MKSARYILVPTFLLLSIIAGDCNAMLPRSSQTHQASTAELPIAYKSNTVSYSGVTFDFDSSLTKEIACQVVLANPHDKPCDIVPQHPAFKLLGFPIPRGQIDDSPEIRVFSISKFRAAMHQAGLEMAQVVSPPQEDWGPWVDEEVRVLKQILVKKPGQREIQKFIAATRDPSISSLWDDYPQMPFLPMWEATQAFIGHVRYVDFKNGKGVFFLTQWNTEAQQLSNEGLEYAFQGITNDGKHWVYAEFAVHAPFLPKSSEEPQLEAWNEKNYLLPHESKEYQDYALPVIAKLEALPDDQFQPSLRLLEQLIQSLEVQIKE